MNPEKAKFIELCIRSEVLRFGAFTLKSGRISPYFFNAGQFNNGALLGEAARHYARMLNAKLRGAFMLYGPAYKGIPLAAAVAMRLADDCGRAVGYAFNRKEAKRHAEGGHLVGAPLRGDVVIVDDVISAGLSVREAVGIIRAAGAAPHAVAVALDRAEVADSDSRTAAQQVEAEHGIAVHAIITLDDLIAYLQPDAADAGTDDADAARRRAFAREMSRHADAIAAYRERYGVD